MALLSYCFLRRGCFALLVLSCSFGSAVRAQEYAAEEVPPRAPLIVGAYAHGSIIIAHTNSLRHLVTSHPTGFELNFQRQTTGAEPWHGWYKYPKVGLALIYYNFHNPILGHVVAASPYISKSFSHGPRHDLSFRLGTGLAYITNPYNRETNYRNNMSSSAFNATIQLRFEYDYALTPRLGLLAGLGLNHYSNGATSKPNLGANLPTLVLGLNYHEFRAVPRVNANAPAPADLGRTFYNVSTSLGYRQRVERDPRKFAVYSLTAAVGRRVNRKSNLVAGVDGFYDTSLTAQLKDTTRAGIKYPDVKKAGVFVGHELLFGRLAFVSHLGIYAYSPYKSSTFYYERLGLKYQFTNVAFGSVDLKVHRGSADVIEFRIGARL
ncbi:acyloxyacyl hydrolase [Hymenobacter arizonensis]|uniref:Lipid A 3-O-deacylase (PagL) n=1 Tax=Hymenobacter arizonensis TaxID=1227077 RepID=A0A1I5YBQ0_HYMAR|nr:acyloxyacyl hydrolase [Hymenobacter arizonensis]SFQ41655.1 Lipid A 3-O-deacylase (PagL) [Hymenobacter arizonensis]